MRLWLLCTSPGSSPGGRIADRLPPQRLTCRPRHAVVAAAQEDLVDVMEIELEKRKEQKYKVASVDYLCIMSNLGASNTNWQLLFNGVRLAPLPARGRA